MPIQFSEFPYSIYSNMSDAIQGAFYKTCEWTPRLICVSLAGYYSLGVAYSNGWMAQIDSIAIPILRRYYGYFGVGAVMPVFQQYSAIGVRFLAATGASFAYSVLEKVAITIYKFSIHYISKAYNYLTTPSSLSESSSEDTTSP